MIGVDNRIGERPKEYIINPKHKRALMQVPNEIKKCVIFVMYINRNGEDKMAGTAFFANEYDRSLGIDFQYVITAKHVIEKAYECSTDGMIYLRLNTTDGGIQKLPTEYEEWMGHPDSNVDVAAYPWPDDDELEAQVDGLCYPLSASAVDQVIKDRGVGIGDEVCFVGLFKRHYGENKNIPILRIGHIAAMPEEPVRVQWNGEKLIDAYLIEARSIGGFSGCPVFVHLFDTRYAARKIVMEDGVPIHQLEYDKLSRVVLSSSSFFLLGLMHGHWDIDETEIDVAIDATDSTESVLEKINTGIGVVVPVQKIIETINQESLAPDRAAKIEGARKKRGATPDTAIEDDEPSGVNRDEFLNALGKIRRPDQPQSEQGKSET